MGGGIIIIHFKITFDSGFVSGFLLLFLTPGFARKFRLQWNLDSSSLRLLDAAITTPADNKS